MSKNQVAVLSKMEKYSRWRHLLMIIISLAATLVMLEIGLRAVGWIVNAQKASRNKLTSTSENEYRILCLGESTTAYFPNSPHSCWPSELELLLNKQSSTLKFKVINEGAPGTDFRQILAHLEGYLNQSKPHLVIAMMGINNQCSTRLPFTFQDHGLRWLSQLKVFKLLRLIWIHWQNTLQRLWEHAPTSLAERLVAAPRFQRLLNSCCLIATVSAESTPEESTPVINNALDRAHQLVAQWRYEEACEAYEQAIQIEPDRFEIYEELANVYRDRKLPELVERTYVRYSERNPKDCKGHIKLAMYYTELYSQNGKYNEVSMQYFRKAGNRYERALELCPTDIEALFAYGEYYVNINLYRAIELMERALAYKPDEPQWMTSMLANCYMEVKQFDNAQRLMEEIVQRFPTEHSMYLKLGEVYEARGFSRKAKECFTKAEQLRRQYLVPFFFECYQRLYEMVKAHNSSLIVMQYPLRDVSELKLYLPDKPDVLFVSNKETFEAALNDASYADLFTDRFAGDFGHCTKRGNMLIAEHLATIIREQLRISDE